MPQTIQTNKSERLPGLNGLRAIAILMLVFGHLCQADFWYGNCPLPSIPIPGGGLSIFFVLCGFLAGYYANTISSPKAYYIKKTKKLFPAYYIYIGLVIIVYILIGQREEVLNTRLLYYIVPAGIIPFCKAHGILPLVHLWFLTPIVISYISFPLLFKAFRGGSRTASASIICAIFIILKFAIYLTAGKETFAYRFFSASQFDCIFGGLFLGLFLSDKKGKALPNLLNSNITYWILWILLLTSGFYQSIIPAPIRNEYFGLLAAGLIIGLVEERSPLKFKASLWKKLSNISYQIYVYHILAIILISELFRLFI